MCSCVVRTEPYLHNLAISASPNKATVTRQRQLAFGLAPQLPEGDRLQGNDERCCQSMPGETVLSSYRTSTGLITCVFANKQASEHLLRQIQTQISSSTFLLSASMPAVSLALSSFVPH